MQENERVMEELEELQERLHLADHRIKEALENENLTDYFQMQFQFASMLIQQYRWIAAGGMRTTSIVNLAAQNKMLYADIVPEHYEASYCNPTYACAEFGHMGQYLCVLAAEMRAAIPAVAEQRIEELVIRLELLLEIFGIFQVSVAEKTELKIDEIQEAMYWYFSDYLETSMERRVAEQVNPDLDFFVKIVKEEDLSNNRYLYLAGEYVTENEIELAEYLRKLPQDKINLIAKTWTEGYRIGFEVTRKNLAAKKTVEVIYSLGFERIVKKAIENFESMGLRVITKRTSVSILQGKGLRRKGFYGAIANPQFDYDHREDLGLFLNKNLLQRKIEVLQNAFEKEKKWANVHAGPAVLETFGEPDFMPIDKEDSVKYTDAQQRDMVTYASKAGEITNQYIIGEERSFTIIAFPLPSIGENFPQIFDETVRLNTLDYQLYSRIQQKIIDILDEAVYVVVKGKDKNQTNMKVMLHKLKNRATQTNFENCVADVNIPVGEVFTSPVLTGTEGILHIPNVFLNGLRYENLMLQFQDGMIISYHCTNYEEQEKNLKFIKDTVLFHHDTLPIGEFAIGTNTTAFVMAKKLGIMNKLPILIAEKTGPHFAVGDTCYSHEEDVKSYNPDGKEIVAKENERSMGRKQNPEESYYNCHTDITIPYDELREISIVRADNTMETIIEDGRFVLPGCEELNRPFDA